MQTAEVWPPLSPFMRVKLTDEYRKQLMAWFPDPGELKRAEEACEAVGGPMLVAYMHGFSDGEEKSTVLECMEYWQGK